MKNRYHDFIDYSLEQFELAISSDDITYDLHKSPLQEGNVTTEYEERFIGQGASDLWPDAYRAHVEL